MKMRKSIVKLLIAEVIAAVIIALIFDAFKWEPTVFEVNHTDVSLTNWSPAHEGLRVLIISDIHLKNTAADMERLENIVSAANAEKPDLIFLLGDFLGATMDWRQQNATPEQIAKILKQLTAKYGVFAVLGNHDWWINGNGIWKALESSGIRVLENEVETLLVNHEPLNIIGLPDYGTRNDRFDPDVLPDPETPSLVLAHDPDIFKEHVLPYEMTFAGHTHGGQVKIPMMGAVTASSSLMSMYTEGMFQENGRKLFVTRGIGTSLARIRFLCLPEIVVFTIHKKQGQ